jgi:hypothetical protein
MSLVLQSSGGGQITIQEPATASNFTQNLPAATGTVALLQTPSFATTIGVGGATPSTSGAGITFPATQSASSDANTLDDYEEGTYTANLSAGGSGSITMLSSEDTAYYIKVGRLVMVTGRITAASVSSPTGELRINLPFTIANITEQSTALAGSVFVWNATGAAETGLWCLFSDINQAFVFLRYGNSATPGASASNVQTNTEVRFTITYVSA